MLTKLLLLILTGEKQSHNSKKEKAVKVVEEIFVTTAMLLVPFQQSPFDLSQIIIEGRWKRICQQGMLLVFGISGFASQIFERPKTQGDKKTKMLSEISGLFCHCFSVSSGHEEIKDICFSEFLAQWPILTCFSIYNAYYYSHRLTVTMACNLNLRTFPHDVQTCTVMLESCKSNVFSIFRVHAWIDLILISSHCGVSQWCGLCK